MYPNKNKTKQSFKMPRSARRGRRPTGKFSPHFCFSWLRQLNHRHRSSRGTREAYRRNNSIRRPRPRPCSLVRN